MKKRVYLLIVLGLAATWIGCKKSEPAKPSAPKKETAQAVAPTTDGAPTAITFVSLKVPNMV